MSEITFVGSLLKVLFFTTGTSFQITFTVECGRRFHYCIVKSFLRFTMPSSKKCKLIIKHASLFSFQVTAAALECYECPSPAKCNDPAQIKLVQCNDANSQAVYEEISRLFFPTLHEAVLRNGKYQCTSFNLTRFGRKGSKTVKSYQILNTKIRYFSGIRSFDSHQGMHVRHKMGSVSLKR